VESVNNYLTAPELAALIGCRENSYACMRRWLERNRWPFVRSITGFPTVARSFHDSMMAGAEPEIARKKIRVEPNFAALA
jgi:hypothetical protein